MQFKPPRPQPSNLMLRTVWDYFARFFKAPEFGSPVISTYLGGPTAVSGFLPAGSQVFVDQHIVAAYTITSVLADVTGSSATFTLPVGGVMWLMASCDLSCSVAGVGRIVVTLNVDGSDVTPQMIYDSAGAIYRLTLHLTMPVRLAAGSHTVKLRAQKSGAGGTVVSNNIHTGWFGIGP